MDPVVSDDIWEIPQSLFHRSSAAVHEMRQDHLLQKDLIVRATSRTKPTSTFDREDFALLQVIEDIYGISHNFNDLKPAHAPNWDLVADAVNTINGVYRSARQCKARYENILLRENFDEEYLKEPQKTKEISKMENNMPMETSQLFQQGDNSWFNHLFRARHKVMMEIAKKRKLMEQQTSLQPPGEPCHQVKSMSYVLRKYGINYEEALNPMQIDAKKAKTIARKRRNKYPYAVRRRKRQKKNLL